MESATKRTMKSNQSGRSKKSISKSGITKKAWKMTDALTVRQHIPETTSANKKRNLAAADALNVSQHISEFNEEHGVINTDDRLGSTSLNSMLGALPTTQSRAEAKAEALAKNSRGRYLALLAAKQAEDRAATERAATERVAMDLGGYKRKTSKRSRKYRSSRKKYIKRKTRRH